VFLWFCAAAIAAGGSSESDLSYIKPADFVQATALTPSDEPESPDWFSVEWASTKGDLAVEVANHGVKVIEVVWDKSAFVDADRVTSGIVPGTTSRGDIRSRIPDSVVPPGAVLREVVIRESAVHLSSGEDERLVSPREDGSEVSVTLALRRSNEVSYHTQPFNVAVDWSALAGLNTERAAAAKSAENAAKRAEWRLKTRDIKDRRDSAWRRTKWFAAGAAASPVFFGVVVPVALASDPEYTWTASDTGAAVTLGILSTGVTGGIALYYRKKARALDLTLERRPPTPP